MVAYSAINQQTLNPGESVIWTANVIPCSQGYVNALPETGDIELSGRLNYPYRVCKCQGGLYVAYISDFGANIAVPAGETVGEISVAFAINGTTIPATTMRVTPAAVEQFFNVSREFPVRILAGCCQTLSVRNTSAIPILMNDATLTIDREGVVTGGRW